MTRVLIFVFICLATCSSAAQINNGVAKAKQGGDKLKQNASSLLKAMNELIGLSKTGADVDDVKERSISLREGTAKIAEAIDDIRDKLGGESSFKNEKEELTAATAKMKQAVRKLKLTEDDYLQLIVGNGNVNVDHRRWVLSLRLLEIIRVHWLQKELAVISTVREPAKIQRVLDQIKTSLDSVTTILDGIIDIVDDTVITLEKFLPVGGKSTEDEDDKDRRMLRDVDGDDDIVDDVDGVNEDMIDSPEIDEENPPDFEPAPWPKSNKQGSRTFTRQTRQWTGSVGGRVEGNKGGDWRARVNADLNRKKGRWKTSIGAKGTINRGGHWTAGVNVGASARFGRNTVNFGAHGSISRGGGWNAGVRATWTLGK